MSEEEFLVLDELYFVQSFSELQEQTNLASDQLKWVLQELINKGWVKCLLSREGEEPAEPELFLTEYAMLYYLATKAGLMAHNSR